MALFTLAKKVFDSVLIRVNLDGFDCNLEHRNFIAGCE
jgi:hypothetical protein